MEFGIIPRPAAGVTLTLMQWLWRTLTLTPEGLQSHLHVHCYESDTQQLPTRLNGSIM